MEYLFKDFSATFDFHVYFEIGYLKGFFLFVFFKGKIPRWGNSTGFERESVFKT